MTMEYTFTDLLIPWSIVSFIFTAIFISSFFLYSLCSSMKIDSTKLHWYRNRTVVLTGATSGTGLALAIELYKVSANLILVGRNKVALENVINEYLLPISANSPNCTPPPIPTIIIADLSLPELLPQCAQNKNLLHTTHISQGNMNIVSNSTSVPLCDGNGNPITMVKLINELKMITPQIDAVICCAGLSMRDSVDNMNGYTEQYIMNVNYYSISMLCRMLLQHDLINKDDGKLVLISSIQGIISIPWRSTYSASKHALEAYFTSLRHELKLQNKNINVTIVSPGYVHTNLSLNALTGSGQSYSVTDQTTAEGLEPKVVAKMTLAASIQNINDLWLCPPHHKAVAILQHIFPSITNWFIQQKGKKQTPPTVKIEDLCKKVNNNNTDKDSTRKSK